MAGLFQLFRGTLPETKRPHVKALTMFSRIDGQSATSMGSGKEHAQ
jgi:hypothetical protein